MWCALLRRGSKYLALWPDHPILGAVFPENRVKYALCWGRRLIPPFIAFILLWNFVQGGGLQGVSFIYTQKVNWPSALLCVLTLLIIVLHGYYWAGRRAALPLNPKLQLFYTELCSALGKTPAPVPTMLDLAKALHSAVNTLSPERLQEIFNKL